MTHTTGVKAASAAGYRTPPTEGKIKPGQIRNPKGRSGERDEPTGLHRAIEAALLKPIRGTGSRGPRLTPRRFGIRVIVGKAAKGEVKAIKDLLQIREEAGTKRLARWIKLSYLEGLRQFRKGELTEEFFQEQARKKADHRKQIRRDDLALSDLIDSELNRRTTVILDDGERKRVSMLTLIAMACAKQHASGNSDIIRLLQKLEPNDWTMKGPVEYYVALPTQEELAILEQRRKNREELDASIRRVMRS